MVVLTFIITLIYLSQEMLYKTDNLIILLQTLPLFIYSLNIRLLDVSFYSYFYNLRLILFNIGSYLDVGSIGNRVLAGVVGENAVYMEEIQMNMLVMLAQDGNIVRHCLGYIISLLVIMLVGFACGKCCMRDQICVFWREKRSDLELSHTHSQTNSKNQYMHLSSENLTQHHTDMLTYATPHTQPTERTHTRK